ncbi:discoidin domain-containing protein [Aureibaculum sp. 2210JD6-5]|uniref:discoidin domain-containing protein n=1 Tax=Aureibaculum sp. 2210JD6-5 TaxID=3103957 RepID=UPI002AACD885|nr:discoidin domain-containing protein [Aureibaculum sp. 2210JD6-5]MDY7396045.1 discoidin domain-containing protein [Aureibaculum sp. 2210JD6-5]
MKKQYFLVLILLGFFYSCSDDISSVDIDKEPEVEEDVWSVNRPNQHPLNVVVFKPTDGTVEDEMLDKVSSMMLYVQKWYEKQMDMQGYGKKTFGLVTNQHGKLKITVVSGSQSSSYYKTKDREVDNEVNKYFETHPTEKLSNHIFILGKDGSGVPFYGLGKNAFATSKDFTLTSTGKFLDDLELMVCDKLGGIMHELGHGLNLPHCAHNASDLPKIALMSFGNHTYQETNKSNLVFLTGSDCAILNVSETFNSKDKVYYDSDANVKLLSYSVTKDNVNQATTVSGLLTSEVKANHIYVGHNGYPLEGGYDNITFTQALLPTANHNEYSFSIKMPYSDIFNGYQAKDHIELSLVIITENGERIMASRYDYTIDAGSQIPNDDILKNYKAFVFSDRSNWSITANTSTASQTASNMLDGNLNTYWHSVWPYTIVEKGDHIITIDMGEEKTFKGLYFLSDRPGGQFRPKKLSIETSNDGNTWNKIKESAITSIEEAREIKITLDTAVTTKNIRVKVDEIYQSSGTEENLIFTEIDIIKE